MQVSNITLTHFLVEMLVSLTPYHIAGNIVSSDNGSITTR